jgi:hypothetical protein
MLFKTAESSPAQEIFRARAHAHEMLNRIRKLEDSRIGSQNCQSSCSKTTGPIISSRTSSSSCSRQEDHHQLKKLSKLIMLKKILKGSKAKGQENSKNQSQRSSHKIGNRLKKKSYGIERRGRIVILFFFRLAISSLVFSQQQANLSLSLIEKKQTNRITKQNPTNILH